MFNVAKKKKKKKKIECSPNVPPHNYRILWGIWASQESLVVKALPANAGDLRASGSIPGSGRSSAGGNGYPLQHSCLENLRDRGAWWATVHRVAKELDTTKHTCCKYKWTHMSIKKPR